MQELLCYNHRTPEMQYFCRVPKVAPCDPRNHLPTRVRWDWTEDKTRELRDLCWCQSKCICDMRVLLNCLKWHRVSERWKWLRTAQDINQFSCSQRPKINLGRIERTRSNNFTTRIYRNRDEATRLWCCHRTCFDRVISVGLWTECCCIYLREARTKYVRKLRYRNKSNARTVPSEDAETTQFEDAMYCNALIEALCWENVQ